MTVHVQFRLTVQTDEATIYFETMPPMPAPRPGEDVYAGGARGAGGWWRVERVAWVPPQMGAMQPTMELLVTVSWSPLNDRPAPTYDDELGWQQAGPS